MAQAWLLSTGRWWLLFSIPTVWPLPLFSVFWALHPSYYSLLLPDLHTSFFFQMSQSFFLVYPYHPISHYLRII